MSTHKPPNIDFGNPVIFFDSNPEQQESYLYSLWSSLQTSLKISWTGEVPPFHAPGKLRLVFWTSDGNNGIKDYELHEYNVVREAWEALFKMSDVKRALVMGYSGQNPYIKSYGGSKPWANKSEIEKKQETNIERMWDAKEQRSGKLLDIESVINKAEKIEIENETRRNSEANKRIREKDKLLDV